MSTKDFDRLSRLAAKEGGNEGGAYLETLGRFALDQLSEEEWDEFCRRIVGGYRVALETTLKHESPF